MSEIPTWAELTLRHRAKIMKSVPGITMMVGYPGSGKSRYARQLAKDRGADIVSTDEIRQALYGDESIQGKWPEIEAERDRRIQAALSAGRPVVYDATNLTRPIRGSFMEKYRDIAPIDATVMDTSWRQSAVNNLMRAAEGGRKVDPSYLAGLKGDPGIVPPGNDEGFANVTHIPWTSPGEDYDRRGEELLRGTRFKATPVYEGVFFDNDEVKGLFDSIPGRKAYQFTPKDYHTTTNFGRGPSDMSAYYGTPVRARVRRYKNQPNIASDWAGDHSNEGVSVELESDVPELNEYFRSTGRNYHITGSHSGKNGAKYTEKIDFSNGTPIEEKVLNGRFGGSYRNGLKFEPYSGENVDE